MSLTCLVERMPAHAPAVGLLMDADGLCAKDDVLLYSFLKRKALAASAALLLRRPCRTRLCSACNWRATHIAQHMPAAHSHKLPRLGAAACALLRVRAPDLT